MTADLFERAAVRARVLLMISARGHTHSLVAARPAWDGGIKPESPRIMLSYSDSWRKLLVGAIKQEQFDDNVDDDDVDAQSASCRDDPSSRSDSRPTNDRQGPLLIQLSGTITVRLSRIAAGTVMSNCCEPVADLSWD